MAVSTQNPHRYQTFTKPGCGRTKSPRPRHDGANGGKCYLDAAAAMRCSIASSISVTSGAVGVRP